MGSVIPLRIHNWRPIFHVHPFDSKAPLKSLLWVCLRLMFLFALQRQWCTVLRRRTKIKWLMITRHILMNGGAGAFLFRTPTPPDIIISNITAIFARLATHQHKANVLTRFLWPCYMHSRFASCYLFAGVEIFRSSVAVELHPILADGISTHTESVLTLCRKNYVCHWKSQTLFNLESTI